MEIGTHCARDACKRLTFLPIACPHCARRFCEACVPPETHACAAPDAAAAAAAEQPQDKGPDRVRCAVPRCTAYTLELAPATGGAQRAAPGVQHRAPRCERCRGSFCMRHRSFAAHACPAAAPRTEGQLRADAAEARRQKAREALARNFPGFNKSK